MQRNPDHIAIFGGSGAIGRAAAAAFARRGCAVSLFARDEGRLHAAAKEVRNGEDRPVVASAVDVLDAVRLNQAVSDAVTGLGPLTAAVIAVSFPHDQGVLLQDLDEAAFITPLDRFLRAQFLVSRAVAPHLTRGGVVLSLSTPIAKITAPGHLGYAATCAATEAFSRNLAHELAAQGARALCVRAHAISDAPAAGSYTKELFAPKAAAANLTVDEWLAGAAQSTMTGTLPSLSEVGEVIAFLASTHARSMTGTVIDLTAGAIVS